MRNVIPSQAQTVFGPQDVSSSVSKHTSISSVTYCDDAGTTMLPLLRRSKRVGFAASFAFAWKATFPVPEAFAHPVIASVERARVVHGTVVVPPCWIVPHPAGKEP